MTRKVQQIMGIPVSLDIPDAENDDPFEAVFALLRDIDRQFSPYKKQSELSRYISDRLTDEQLSADMRDVMRACKDLEQRTGGYFSAYFKGYFDPTGYTKGWAIKRAGELLESKGLHTYMINAGGDILARSVGDRVWRIGLQHPTKLQEIMGTVSTSNIAVATSGAYARGRHIFDPTTGRPADDLLSVTVIGPDIAIADSFATAVFAMGNAGLDFIETQEHYEALIVGQQMQARMTRGFAPSIHPKTQIVR